MSIRIIHIGINTHTPSDKICSSMIISPLKLHGLVVSSVGNRSIFYYPQQRWTGNDEFTGNMYDGYLSIHHGSECDGVVVGLFTFSVGSEGVSTWGKMIDSRSNSYGPTTVGIENDLAKQLKDKNNRPTLHHKSNNIKRPDTIGDIRECKQSNNKRCFVYDKRPEYYTLISQNEMRGKNENPIEIALRK